MPPTHLAVLTPLPKIHQPPLPSFAGNAMSKIVLPHQRLGSQENMSRLHVLYIITNTYEPKVGIKLSLFTRARILFLVSLLFIVL